MLFTGKGGVGKTTSAAGVATLSARSGLRTLVMSTDAAHSLADALGLGAEIGDDDTAREVETGLWVLQVDGQRRFERAWRDIQGYLLSVLGAAGVDPITAEELTVIPGAEEVLALLELRTQVRSGRYDVIIVDCAPTGETLRLLALPEALGWYMDRIFGMQRKVIKALRPVLTRAAGVPMPDDSVFDAIQRLHADLEEVRQLLSSERASVRLVLTPERVVVAEARRSLTTLCLYGYRVDGVVANRVFPASDSPPGETFLDGWVRAQTAVLDEVRQSFAGLPVWVSSYRDTEPVGTDAVAELAATVYRDADPLVVANSEAPMRIDRTGTGAVLRMALPFAQRSDVDLARHGDELVITVGSHRRPLALPQALSRMRIAGARVVAGALQIRFVAEGGS